MRMPTIKTVMVILLGSHMLLVHSAPQLSHRYRGGSFMSNELTLSCSDDYGNTFSDFWLNSTTIPLTAILAVRLNMGEIDFTITPNLEGLYYCGSISQDLTSGPLELTAYPKLHPVQTYYAVEAGQPVTMQCAISPGKLIQRYTCIWRNTSLPISVGPNYSISYDDFSLTILHTTLSDAGTDWSCHVTVDNPQTRRIDDWHLDSNSLTLVVYERPTFQEHLQSRVEVIEGRDVTLSCAASGGPGLTLSWYHNRVNITQLGSNGSGKYKIIHTTGDRTATSTLTLNQLRINDSGIIACIAMVTVFREDSQDVTPMMFTNFTVTSLVVLEGSTSPSSEDFSEGITSSTAGAAPPTEPYIILAAVLPVAVLLIVIAVTVTIGCIVWQRMKNKNARELRKEADKKDNEVVQIIQSMSHDDDPQKREQKIAAITDRRAAAQLYRRRADTAEDGDSEEGSVQEDASEEGEPDATCRSTTNPNTTVQNEDVWYESSV